jgi:hypothetical protein
MPQFTKMSLKPGVFPHRPLIPSFVPKVGQLPPQDSFMPAGWRSPLISAPSIGKIELSIMKRISIRAAVIVLLFDLAACKKSAPVSAPVFKAVGYWEGNATGTGLFALLNKQDGSGRFYLFIGQSLDTADQIKFDGSYSVIGDTYYANFLDTTGTLLLNLQTEQTSLNAMSGILFQTQHNPDNDQRIGIGFNLVRK